MVISLNEQLGKEVCSRRASAREGYWAKTLQPASQNECGVGTVVPEEEGRSVM
jgi:hypothetical protein